MAGAGLDSYIYIVVTSNVNGGETTNSTAQTINQCTLIFMGPCAVRIF
jgi:hypothetical protein